MKISNELLRKYIRGECNPNEKKAVENWMESSEVQGNLAEEQLATSIDSIREKLFSEIFAKSSRGRIIPLYKKVLKYTVAASIVLAVYMAGALLPNPFKKETVSVKIVEVGYPEPAPALYVSTFEGKAEKIIAKEYNINFEGLIRIYSDSDETQTVICNGKRIELEPRMAYFLLDSKANSFYRLDESSASNVSEDKELPKFYEVCLQS